MTDRSRVFAEVHEMIDARLFGSDPWLAEREVFQSVERKLQELGLQESVSEDTVHATSLGKELEWDLVMVFAGMFCEMEVLMILEQYGLIDGIEVERIYERADLVENAEHILRPIVQKAFLQHYNSSGRLH